MARKKRKRKVFSAVKEAKRRARLVVGTPRPEVIIPNKRKKPPKHKKALLDNQQG